MPFHRSMLAAGFALALALPLAAQATPAGSTVVPDGKWMVRLRALALRPADRSDAIASLAVPADAITVSSKAFPELDITYFVTRHLAAELVLTYPQSHDVEVAGTRIGRFKQLPPTLLAQYHFLPTARIRPYVGAGINLTLISDVQLAVPGVGALDLDDASVGIAGQVGADLRLAPRWFLNADAKWVQIGSDVKLAASGTRVSSVGIDPFLLSVGLGYRF